METIKTQFFDLIQKQGLAFVLICAMAYYFYIDSTKYKEQQNIRMTTLEAKVEDCDRNNREILINQIQQSTITIDRANKIMDRLENEH